MKKRCVTCDGIDGFYKDVGSIPNATSVNFSQMCTATITVIPIWKWEFANGTAPHFTYGATKL